MHGAANLAWMQQDFETATAWVRQAIQLALDHQLRSQYLDLLLPLGRIYLEQGAYDLAAETLAECIQAARTLSKPAELAPL